MPVTPAGQRHADRIGCGVGRACGLYGRHGRDCGSDAVTERTLQVCPDEDVRPTGANSRPLQSPSFPLPSPERRPAGTLPHFEFRTGKGELHETASSELRSKVFAPTARSRRLARTASRSSGIRAARQFSVGERSQRSDDSVYQHDRARTLAGCNCGLRTHIRICAIKTNIADSLNVVVHIERRPGRRYVSEILEINGYEPDADLFDYGAVFLSKRDQA